MTEPLDITYLEEAWEQFYIHGDECTKAGLDDLAHWLGKRAGLMLQEIRILQIQVAGLQATLAKEREAARDAQWDEE